MSLRELPDFQQALRGGGPGLYPSHGEEGAYILLPSGLEVARDPQGKPDFHLGLIRGASPHQPPQPYGILDFRLRPHYDTPAALDTIRPHDPRGTVREARFAAGFLRLQPGRDAHRDDVTALPQEAYRPIPLDWNHLPMPRYVLRLSQAAASLLEQALERELLLVEAVAELELWGVAPRLPATVRFDSATLLDACRDLGQDGVVARDDLLAFFRAGFGDDAGSLPLELEGEPDADHRRLFAESMTDHIRERFGRFVAAPDPAAGGYLALPAPQTVETGRLSWDLSQTLAAPRPLVLWLHPLEAARELVRSQGLGAVVSRTEVPALSTGVLNLAVAANLPLHREGVLSLGVTIQAPPNPPHRLQAIVETVELDPPQDRTSLRLRFSPAEKPIYRYRTFAVVRDARGVRRLQGELTEYQGDHLLLTPEDFPLRFVPVEASAPLLDLAQLHGLCRWQDDDGDVEQPFTLNADRPRITLGLPATARMPQLTLEAEPPQGQGSLSLESPADGVWRVGRHSFSTYGPHRIAVNCVFDAEVSVFTVALQPETEAGNDDTGTVLAFRPQQPRHTWHWFADDPFRAGYRYRVQDRGDGTPGPWSGPRSPFADLTLSVAKGKAVDEGNP